MRECAGPRLVGLVGEGCVVAGPDLGPNPADGACGHQAARGQHRGVAGKGPPHLEGGRGGPPRRGKKTVRHHQPRDPGILLGGDAQTNQRAPVLHEQHDVLQLEAFKPRRHPLDVPQVGVILDPTGLVGAAKTDQVGREHAVAGLSERRNHLAVQVAPSGLAVQQHDRWAVDRTFVEVVHSQRLGVACGHVNVIRFERVVFQVLEP